MYVCKIRFLLRESKRMGACNSTNVTEEVDLSNHAGYSFHENLVRQRHGRDRFNEIYEVLEQIGHGGLCTIYRIRKREESIGGFANMVARSKGRGGAVNKVLHPRKSFKRRGGSKVQTQTKNPNNNNNNSNSNNKEIHFALKVINLALVQEDKIDQLKNEVEILKTLDHKNIIKAYETFSFRVSRTLEIVMELCTGGDLHARMPYSEMSAARVLKQILSAISYVHRRGIIHRDIKFENIMFENTHPEAAVKVIDFGLSKNYSVENPVLTERVGTLYSMSPETMKGHYTTKSDLWSIGVCMYMMLDDGNKPFEGKTPKQLVAKVLLGDVKFESHHWKEISDEAKDFILSLLKVNPDDRVTADDAMKHHWFTSRTVMSSNASVVKQDLIERVQDGIVRYADTGEFRKLALNVIAKKSTPEEIFELRKVFDKFDTLNTGTITLDEFKAALLRFNYSDEEIQEIYRKVDINRTNVIDYTEFLAATLETQGAIEEYRLMECFDQMDSDDSGKNISSLVGSVVQRAFHSPHFSAFRLQGTSLERTCEIFWGNTPAKNL